MTYRKLRNVAEVDSYWKKIVAKRPKLDLIDFNQVVNDTIENNNRCREAYKLTK